MSAHALIAGDNSTLDRIQRLTELVAVVVVGGAVLYELAQALATVALGPSTPSFMALAPATLAFSSASLYLWANRRRRSDLRDLAVVAAATAVGCCALLYAGRHGAMIANSDTALMMICAPVAVSLTLRLERSTFTRTPSCPAPARWAIVGSGCGLLIAVSAVVSALLVRQVRRNPCQSRWIPTAFADPSCGSDVSQTLDRKVVAFYLILFLCLLVLLWFARDLNEKVRDVNGSLLSRARKMLLRRLGWSGLPPMPEMFELGMEIRRLRARRLPNPTTVRYLGELTIEDAVFLNEAGRQAVRDLFEGLVVGEDDLVSVLVQTSDRQVEPAEVTVSVYGLKRSAIAVPATVAVQRAKRGDGAELTFTAPAVIDREPKGSRALRLPFITDEVTTRAFALLIVASLLDLLVTPAWVWLSGSPIPFVALLPGLIVVGARALHLMRRGGGMREWGRRAEVAEIGLLDRILLAQVWFVGAGIIMVAVISRGSGVAIDDLGPLAAAPPLPFAISLAATVMSYGIIVRRRVLAGWLSASVAVMAFWVIIIETNGESGSVPYARLLLSWPAWLLAFTALALLAGSYLRGVASEVLVRGDTLVTAAIHEELGAQLADHAQRTAAEPLCQLLDGGLPAAVNWLRQNGQTTDLNVSSVSTSAYQHCRIEGVLAEDADLLVSLVYWVRVCGGTAFHTVNPDDRLHLVSLNLPMLVEATGGPRGVSGASAASGAPGGDSCSEGRRAGQHADWNVGVVGAEEAQR